jgi:hypothetical protein
MPSKCGYPIFKVVIFFNYLGFDIDKQHSARSQSVLKKRVKCWILESFSYNILIFILIFFIIP